MAAIALAAAAATAVAAAAIAAVQVYSLTLVLDARHYTWIAAKCSELRASTRCHMMPHDASTTVSRATAAVRWD